MEVRVLFLALAPALAAAAAAAAEGSVAPVPAPAPVLGPVPRNGTAEAARGVGNGSATVPLLRKGSPSSPVPLANATAARPAGARASAAAPANATEASPSTAALSGMVPVSTFFWNVHWQCSVAARGASRACKDRASRRFVELARGANAEIVASIELSHGMSQPVSLPGLGLEGWTQVDGPCARGYGGDSAALAFAPGWTVERRGGGCLRHDYDTRAFAVARVVPPHAVQGCPALCVVAIHAPHSSITRGRDVVQSVCGDAVGQCVLAMGDWNVPTYGIGRLWGSLIGGNHPSVAHPNERTCCFPESHHYGIYDHVSTNIAGAGTGGHYVHPYQILEENPVQQHRPVSAQIVLPAGR